VNKSVFSALDSFHGDLYKANTKTCSCFVVLQIMLV